MRQTMLLMILCQVVCLLPEQVSCVLAPCSWNKDCESCIQASSFGESCHWCRRDNSCHSSISIFNSCRQADNVVLGGQDQCSTPMRTFNTTLANLTLAASISAHFQHGDPSLCMSTMLPESDFVVTRTHEGKCHEDFQSDQCYGYNAISHKERAILIAFRGTIDWNQGMSEIITTLLYSKSDFLDGSVQNYFYNAFINVWPPLEADLIQLRLYYPNYRVLVTGFSLGGAIASLASAFIVFNGLADNSQVFLYTFGMPRVGDYAYATYHDQLVPNSWRIVRQKDPIPQVPSKIQIGRSIGKFINTPYHHGVEVYYQDDSTSLSSGYKECHGKPFNEDPRCSWGDMIPSRSNHIFYFGIHLGKHCNKLWASKQMKMS